MSEPWKGPCIAAALVLVLVGCGSTDNGVGLEASSTAPDDIVQIINAIDGGDTEALGRLLDAGAKPTPPGSRLSAIHAAITHFKRNKLGCDSIALNLLLTHGADPNFVDDWSGFAPMEDALAIGDMNCATMLKDAGAKVTTRGKSGQSLLQFAVKGAVRTGNPQIIDQVVAWGVDPNILSAERGFTALHEAVWQTPGQPVDPVIAELLHVGTNPCATNSSGQTAFEVAVDIKRSESMQRLLRNAMKSCPPKAASTNAATLSLVAAVTNFMEPV
jgi:hypothetical protein